MDLLLHNELSNKFKCGSKLEFTNGYNKSIEILLELAIWRFWWRILTTPTLGTDILSILNSIINWAKRISFAG